MRLEEVPELTLPIIKPNRDYFCQYCDKVWTLPFLTTCMGLSPDILMTLRSPRWLLLLLTHRKTIAVCPWAKRLEPLLKIVAIWLFLHSAFKSTDYILNIICIYKNQYIEFYIIYILFLINLYHVYLVLYLFRCIKVPVKGRRTFWRTTLGQNCLPASVSCVLPGRGSLTPCWAHTPSWRALSLLHLCAARTVPNSTAARYSHYWDSMCVNLYGFMCTNVSLFLDEDGPAHP